MAIASSSLLYYSFRRQIHSLDVRHFNALNKTGLNPILPDAYSCDGCHRNCDRYIIKLGLASLIKPPFICQPLACIYIDNKGYDGLCSKNWRYSRHLKYEAFSKELNLCINSYKNTTYPLAISGKTSANYLLTSKQIDAALSEGIYYCLQLEKVLKEEKFASKQRTEFYSYINSFAFIDDEDVLGRRLYQPGDTEKYLNRFQEVVDFLKANPDSVNKAVPKTIVDNFARDYFRYS